MESTVSPAASSMGWIDTSSRSAVQAAYLNVYVPAGSTAMGWTGNIDAGNAGTTTQAYKNAVELRINWLRALAGINSNVSLESTRNTMDQQAALMATANNDLSHYPPTSARFYTTDGATAAANSNLCLGYPANDIACLEFYMNEFGAGNYAIGHRRWLLYPQTSIMGTGDIPATPGYYSANALWVLSNTSGIPRPATREEFVSWPPRGYVPYEFATPRWSFSYAGADFTSASVTMTRNGASVPVSIEPIGFGYGESTLVWVPDNIDANQYVVPTPPAGGDSTAIVTVNNVKIGGVARSFTYAVTLFDPYSNSTGGNFSFSATSATVGPTGGTGSVNLIANQPAGYTAVSTADWLTITGGGTGSGSGTISYSVAPNTTAGTRTGQIVVGNATFSVTESGAAVPSVVSLSPMASGGSNQVFTVQVSDADGYQDLDVINVLVNNFLDGRQACYLAYARSNNVLYIVPDSGNAAQLTGHAMDGTGYIANSQCTVTMAGSSVSGNGTTLTLTLNIAFAPWFGGAKVVYVAGRDAAQHNSGWETMGVYNVAGAPVTYPRSVDITPASGTTSTQMMTFNFQDSGGATNIQTSWVIVNKALDARSSCMFAYYRPGNQIYLYPDSGDGSQSTVFTLTGTNSASNSQCTVGSQGASVTTNGNTLTLTLPMTFKSPAFTGHRAIWTATQTMGGVATSNWQALGAWWIP